jgi:hypothetical protein
MNGKFLKITLNKIQAGACIADRFRYALLPEQAQQMFNNCVQLAQKNKTANAFSKKVFQDLCKVKAFLTDRNTWRLSQEGREQSYIQA